jgi:peptidylprolyl isomerase
MRQKPTLSRKRLALRSGISWRKMPPANMRLHRLQSFALCTLLPLAFAPLLGCNKTPPEPGAGAQKQSAAAAASSAAPIPEAAKSAEAPPPEVPAPAQPNAIPAPADVAAAPADAKTTATGLKLKVLKAGTGKDHPKDGDRVSVHYSGWTKDGKMFDSSVARGTPTTFGVNEVIPGWTEALKLMAVGEKTRLWIPGKLAYGDRPQMGGAPSGDLTFDVELLGIVKPPAAPEDVKAPPATAKKTSSGLAYRVLKAGTGKIHPTATNRVTVHYSGWTPDGKMFDSSVARGEPSTFPLNGVVKGWTEGVQLMVVGEKTRFWIPGALAYGDKPQRPGAPAGMLVFDIELLNIQ